MYKGAVAAAFNQLEEAEQFLAPLVNGPTESKEADEADRLLTYFYVRNGQYKKAAAGMDEQSALFHTLKSLPDQSVARWGPSSLACRISQHKVYVPAAVDGKTAEFFLDSDANFSFLSASQARKLGLAIRDTNLTVHGAGGSEAGFRTAVASELMIGNVALKDVAFLVMADSEDVFSGARGIQTGALGLPVLMALRRVTFSKTTFEIGAATLEKPAAKESNLCFDGLDLVAQVEFDGQRLPVILDTGSEVTELWPPFANRFLTLMSGAGRLSSSFERSFGGRSSVPQRTIAELTLRVAGFTTRLAPAHILLQSTTPNSARYYARLGADTLDQARQVSLDFDSLRLSLY